MLTYYLSIFQFLADQRIEDVADISKLQSSEVLNVVSDNIKYFLSDEGIQFYRINNVSVLFNVPDSSRVKPAEILCIYHEASIECSIG